MLYGALLLILDTFENMEDPSLTEPPDNPSRWESDPDMEDLKMEVIEDFLTSKHPPVI